MDQIIDLLNNSSIEDENLIPARKEIRRDKILKTPKARIAINNSVYGSDDVFIKDGEPTDSFLEALRRDLGTDFDFFHDEQNSQTTNTKRVGTASADNTPRVRSKTMNKQDITSSSAMGDTGKVQEAIKQLRRQKCFQDERVLASSNMNKKWSKKLEQGQMGHNIYHENKNVKNSTDNVCNNNQQMDQVAMNKDLRSTNAKLQSKLRAIEKIAPSRSDHEEEKHVDFLTKEIDDLKKKLHLSEMRTDEEISERLKWEERCRNWKSSVEQMKKKLHAMENSVNRKLESESMKLGKTSRRIISNLETDIVSLKSQLLDVQNKLQREELTSSDLLSRIEKSNVLIQDLKNERRRLLEQVEELDIQLGVITQRERVRHITDKLQTVPPPPKSNSESTHIEFLEQKPLSSSIEYSNCTTLSSNKRSVPVKFLFQPTIKSTNIQSSHNLYHNTTAGRNHLAVEANTTAIEQNLHSDTVALIKTIAAKTVTSLPRNAVRNDVEKFPGTCVTSETAELDKLYEKIRGVR